MPLFLEGQLGMLGLVKTLHLTIRRGRRGPISHTKRW